MAQKVTPISQAEMVRQREALERRILEQHDYYSIEDVAFLAGWSMNYIRILEKKGLIPVSKRLDDEVRGIGPIVDGRRRKPLGKRRWTEEQVRVILGFKRDQESKRSSNSN